ncbi:hypothetical protein [Ferruginibacter albus]|uniref:hypothetical protein n=1 Tax=Ferruginibacter albus TaxID=2875540 RepID=UPI001CC4ED4C|nr:hypothetical protein [Ferruginibacter albus]UAY52083.1 hypothetical protein K9M53_16020 [Ferruginibacter albus]
MEYTGYITLNSNYLLGDVDLKKLSILFDNLYFDEAEFTQCSQTLVGDTPMSKKVKSIYGDNIEEVIKGNIADVNFLTETKLLRPVNPVQIEESYISKNPNSTYSKFLRQYAEQTHSYFFQGGSIISSILSLSSFLQKNLYNPDYENNRALMLCDLLQKTEDRIVSPIFNPTNLNISEDAAYTSDKNLLNVVISKFPILNQTNLSWERIIDFKNDPETKTNQLRLRNWMLDISKTELSVFEIEQKLEYLLNEYEVHLKRHEFEFKYSILKDVLITTSEIAEKIITLKFSDAMRTILEIGNRKLKLFDIKENAPGKEVAIFYETKKLSNN